MIYSRRHSGPINAIKYFILGSPLRNTAIKHEQLGIIGGLAVLGSDALSSIAYATEEIMLALSVLGPHAFCLSIPIASLIAITIFIVIMSYRQTVEAYPHGGGAYIVAKNQLGRLPSLIAAGSLLMDYVLTVAVSIAAGVRALTSLYAQLTPYIIEISLGAVVLLCWINLRGMRESVRILAWPLYGFLLSVAALCMYGFIHAPQTTHHTIPISYDWVNLATIFVLLRAFSSGCTAMTGIEAIANAGPLLKNPSVLHAQRIYIILGLLLAGLFMAITILVQQFHLYPQTEQSLLSQLGRLLYGESIVYTGLQLFTAIVLFLAANTAFADYPRLCAILARDGWLPKQLATVGDRLVFHKGIILLSILSAIFLFFFHANVHMLIPLYAIGVLIAFTLSQSGMMRYWLTYNHPSSSKTHSGTKVKLSTLSLTWRIILSGLGACTTGLVLLIFIEAKFMEGAYLSFIVIPLLCLICLKIHQHYHDVEQQLSLSQAQIMRHKLFSKTGQRQALVPISRMHLGTLEALSFAREITKDVIAVLVDINPIETQITKNTIQNLQWDITIVSLKSPYRSILNPLLEYLSSFTQDTLIIFPEIVPKKWWQKFLHNETVIHLIRALEWQAPLSGQTRIIMTVPYHLKK